MSAPPPPRLLRALLARIARPASRDDLLRDLDDEYRSRIVAGETPRDARRWYRSQVLGSIPPLLVARLGLDGLRSLRTSWIDVRLGIRMLAKYPGLTLATVLSLAVGIPVGLAPWHAADVFEAELPVPEGHEIRVLKRFDPVAGSWDDTGIPDWASWQANLTSVRPIGAVLRSTYNLDSGDDQDPTIAGAILSASGFETLQVAPVMGRAFTAEDERPGAPDVVILGYDLWRTRFLADPEILGRTVRIGGEPHDVIGVMPEGFRFPYQDHLWLPLRSEDPAVDPRSAIVFGRLADGVGEEAAAAEFRVLESRSDGRVGRSADEEVAFVPMLVPFTEGLFGLRPGGLRAELGFYFVQAIALMVLVVACVNISMLLLVRTTTRARELSVRAALGAGRARIVGQLVVEAFVLSVLAAGLGLVVADQVASRLTFIGDQLPYWADLGVTWGTSIQALVFAALCAAIVGVLPALRVTGGSIQRAIQQASAGRTGVRFGGVASGLIVTDVALAVVISGFAIAFSDAVLRALPAETSGTVQGDEYLVAEFRVPTARGLDTPFGDAVANDAASRTLLTRLAREPGVRSVAMADAFPGMDRGRAVWEVAGSAPTEEATGSRSDVVRALPGFFEALDQPLRQGRSFREGEATEERPGVVVNLQFADEFFEGRSPLGRQIRQRLPSGEPGPWREIVGVVGGIANSGTAVRPRAVAYLPASPADLFRPKVAIRVEGDPTTFAPRLREIATEIDPRAIVAEVSLLSDARSFDLQVFGWVFLGMRVLVGVLIALAASGTYALLSFTISERTHEIAIRTALGAPPGAILRTIGTRAAAQLIAGAILGMAIVAAMFRQFILDGWRPGTSPLLLALATGVGVVLTIGFLAGVGPARRGLAIEPEEALRL